MKNNGGEVSRIGPLAQKIEDCKSFILAPGPKRVDQGSWKPRTEQNLAMTTDDTGEIPTLPIGER